ncbi:MAG: thiamine pyrophosphate-binding protein [Chloroflexi bacterium]|nr:thiamine pyrophosphate-binding protein [Chloroflexota bacterium]
MKLAELIVDDAKKRGIDHMFGIPGSGFPLDVLEAGRTGGVRLVLTAHESSAAIAAACYGAMKGTPGIAIAVKGVGAGNLVGGAVNAHFERLAVLCLSEAGDPNSDIEMTQIANHDLMFGAVAKLQHTFNHETAGESLQRAIFTTSDGRPGPVVLNVTGGMSEGDVGTALPNLPAAMPDAPDMAALDRIADVVKGAERVVVIAGADVMRHGAMDELAAFVESIGAAVLTSMEARGVFPESDSRWAGLHIGGYGPNHIETDIVNAADLVLLVGVDAMMTHAPWGFDLPTAELVARPEYTTMSPNPIAKADGDLKASLSYLTSKSQSSGGGFSIDEISAIKDTILKLFARPEAAKFAQQDIIEISRRLLPEEGVLVSETGAFVRFLEHLWAVDRPERYIGTSGGRTMGLMIPAALGAKLAKPDVPMIGIGADGSTLMRLGELEAFAREGVVMPLIIINDHALGTMKSRQKSRGMVDYGLDLQPVNFAQIALAVGLNGVVVNTPEQFELALTDAFDADVATVIDARVDPQPYWDSFGPSIGVLD